MTTPQASREAAPSTSAWFDQIYRFGITPWGDVRIPPEVKALAARAPNQRVLELGCGIGRFSRWVARQGHRSVAVDFSPVAIAKARERAARESERPAYLVGDVTKLTGVEGEFDAAFDVGCFHCLSEPQMREYAAATHRLLRPGATLLVWTLDRSPSHLDMTPAFVQRVFAPHYRLAKSEKSRRRIVASHWHWLERAS